MCVSDTKNKCHQSNSHLYTPSSDNINGDLEVPIIARDEIWNDTVFPSADQSENIEIVSLSKVLGVSAETEKITNAVNLCRVFFLY